MNLLSDPAARLVIAHRGTSAHFPENTLAAFDHALSLGVDALEFDVRMSRDGVAVVIHDPTVDRTTGASAAVETLTVRELQALDAGERFTRDHARSFPFRGQGLRVPLLDDVFARYDSVPLLIEVKIAGAVDETRRLIARHGAGDRVLMDSTAMDAVSPFRGTGLLTGASFRDVVVLLPRALTGRAPATLPYAALCIPPWYKGIPVPVRRLARVAHACGVPTHVWTINNAGVARELWRAGVNGIITDDPAAMLQVRAAIFGT